MCPASASASAGRSCGLRMRPMLQEGSSGNPSAGSEDAHARPQRQFGKDRDREAGEHGRRHRAGIRAGVEQSVGAPGTVEVVDCALPPDAARTPERKRQPFLDMGRMPVRRHPQQALAAENLHRPAALAIGDDGEVELVAPDQRHQFDRGLAEHGQFDARIGARESRHDFRKIAVGVIVGHARGARARSAPRRKRRRAPPCST